MTISFTKGSFRFKCAALSLFVAASLSLQACGTAPDAASASPTASESIGNPSVAAGEAPSAPMPGGPMIEIQANSPADTVRVFYQRLRDKQFIAALMLTNLRPAVEGLTEEEMKDLGVDFAEIAESIPPQMPINGEIVSGDEATVTMKMPNEKDGKLETSEIRLRKDGKSWMMVVVDEVGEQMVRKEGKNYFFALRMEVHHAEAQAMLERINKAQGIYALQSGGKFAELESLIDKGYLPADAASSASTGYNYKISLAFDKSTYSAFATPAEYGKTGRLSFATKIRKGAEPELVSKDVGGKILQN